MFKAEELFDLRHTSHHQIFHQINYAWEAIAKIKKYVDQHLQPQNLASIKGEPHIEGLVQIGEGTIIEPGVVIKGPVIIGKNCLIRSGAYIREYSIIGDRVIIGNSTETKHCLLMNDVKAPHFNYIGDSILGFKAHLGAGVIISNVKIPPTEIKVVTMEKIYQTGLKKFGALIGDEAEIGCNSVLNPGTILGKGCLVYPGVMFRGVAAANSIVKLRQEHDIIIKRNIS